MARKEHVMLFLQRLLILASLASLGGVAFGEETSPEIAVTVTPAAARTRAKAGHQVVWVGMKNISPQAIYFMRRCPWIPKWHVRNPLQGSKRDWNGFVGVGRCWYAPRGGPCADEGDLPKYVLPSGAELLLPWELDVRRIPIKEVTLSVDVELFKIAQDLKCSADVLYRGTGTATIPITGRGTQKPRVRK